MEGFYIVGSATNAMPNGGGRRYKTYEEAFEVARAMAAKGNQGYVIYTAFQLVEPQPAPVRVSAYEFGK